MENQLTEITKDLFLGGKLSLLQPKKGFRAGLDSVLLAAAVNAKSGEKVFEIGSGVGTVLFCLMSRISGLKATAIEIMNEYHSLSLINASFCTPSNIISATPDADLFVSALPKLYSVPE